VFGFASKFDRNVHLGPDLSSEFGGDFSRAFVLNPLD
jgi:hypothetical protein